ncbi:MULTISPECIES: EF-P beta-lysylation protein EpmB [unclassified Thioalkalivibrio]|uniref:EF-P beta-lysylation protein EpmB n=1 Tax=unclassified Thioalkalivibrio TaxID=2621013 RepID=UPI000370D6D2|nr:MULTISPECIES: EF-P beta-lysylation protein EpmB [unclassified Thioalkalivibrio]
MPTKPIMITRTPRGTQPSDRTHTGDTTPAWQQALARAIRDPETLARELELDPAHLPGLHAGHTLFRVRVPRSYLARMRKADPQDPLLLQVLPQQQESEEHPGFVADPVGDHDALAAPGLVHKYHGRVLLLTTGACAVHCRYCFRREFPYAEHNASQEDWAPALAYIHADSSIREVILSGGDPLSLSDPRLADLVRRLEAIPHLERLRIHTRLPVVLPERVDNQLLNWLGKGRLHHVLVLHANHPREFADPAAAALARLRARGITLLNQAVLLAGINDDPDTLCELQEDGFRHGILPYYLHLLDRTRGTAHFEVTEQRALELHQALHARLPGYLVPRLVREVPGEPGKTPRWAGL